MSHKRNEALRHVQHSMYHVIAAGEGSDRAPDSCKLCPYYRPDFKFRTCLYAHCLIRSRSMYSVPHLKNGIFSISDDVPMALCYDPRQVITLAGKRYLSGAVVFVRYDTNGSFVALTTSDLYLIQCYLAENSVPLMAGREKI